MAGLHSGADPLDAVIEGVAMVEEDPGDTSVGFGGLPNEEGVVELDAAVMHGPSHRAGAVAALRSIKTPSRVARLVMERTDHVLLVGEGALRFARAHGFREEDLLTETARQQWLQWKERSSETDDWLPDDSAKHQKSGRLTPWVPPEDSRTRHHGTVHISALDRSGNLAGATSTSGLSYKIPGRVGDSPIIGAGLYVDNEVGAAGSTGRGEANLVNCSTVMIVEWMRDGATPEEACLEACRRIVRHNHLPRLQNSRGEPSFDVRFFALKANGEYGGGQIFSGGSMAVHDGSSARLVELPSLFAR
jgi:N4-(beta-N-acetylglucosaminyl)-L-asparaginase